MRGIQSIMKQYQNTKYSHVYPRFSRSKQLFMYSHVYIVYSITSLSTFTMARSKINELVESLGLSFNCGQWKKSSSS